MLSEEETELEDFGLDSLITGVEITRTVKQLRSNSAEHCCCGAPQLWKSFILSSSKLWVL